MTALPFCIYSQRSLEASSNPELPRQQLVPLGPDADAAMEEVKKAHPDVIVIDFTHPTAVNPNADFYAKHKLPYIMGTTGGDRDALRKVRPSRLRSSRFLALPLWTHVFACTVTVVAAGDG